MVNILNKTLKRKSDCFEYFKKQFTSNKVEHIFVIGLKNKFVIFAGDVSEDNKRMNASMYTEKTVKHLAELGCDKFIMAHNHPNNFPLPSADDRTITRKLIKLGKQYRCKLIEHYVYADNFFWGILKDSFKEEERL